MKAIFAIGVFLVASGFALPQIPLKSDKSGDLKPLQLVPEETDLECLAPSRCPALNIIHKANSPVGVPCGNGLYLCPRPRKPKAAPDCQCLLVSECPALHELALRRKFDELKQHKRCGFESTDIKLCCPQDGVSSVGNDKVLENQADQPINGDLGESKFINQADPIHDAKNDVVVENQEDQLIHGDMGKAKPVNLLNLTDDDISAKPQETLNDSYNQTSCHCLLISECPALQELALRGKFNELGQHKLCAYENTDIKLCCPQDGVKSIDNDEVLENQTNQPISCDLGKLKPINQADPINDAENDVVLENPEDQLIPSGLVKVKPVNQSDQIDDDNNVKPQIIPWDDLADCHCLHISECRVLYELALERRFHELRQHKKCGYDMEVKLCCPQDDVGGTEDDVAPDHAVDSDTIIPKLSDDQAAPNGVGGKANETCVKDREHTNLGLSCGLHSFTELLGLQVRIHGGEDSGSHDHPWAAAIWYNKLRSDKLGCYSVLNLMWFY